MDLCDNDIKLINRVQNNFPICSDPFAKIASELGFEKRWVIERLKEMQGRNIISRFGSVVKRKRNSYSLLAAIKVPDERVNDISHLVSSYEEVTHNYLREHEYNLWFVVEAKTKKKLDSILEDLMQHMDFELIKLPILESYHSDSVIKL